MAKSHGAQIKRGRLYEKLRGEGMGKEKAARISNARANPRQHPSRKGGKSAPYDDWSKDALYDRAKELGIDGRSKMTKGQLIGALRSR